MKLKKEGKKKVTKEWKKDHMQTNHSSHGPLSFGHGNWKSGTVRKKHREMSQLEPGNGWCAVMGQIERVTFLWYVWVHCKDILIAP